MKKLWLFVFIFFLAGLAWGQAPLSAQKVKVGTSVQFLPTNYTAVYQGELWWDGTDLKLQVTTGASPRSIKITDVISNALANMNGLGTNLTLVGLLSGSHLGMTNTLGTNYFMGPVGIGLTNPTAKLDVEGDARVTGTMNVSNLVASRDISAGYGKALLLNASTSNSLHGLYVMQGSTDYLIFSNVTDGVLSDLKLKNLQINDLQSLGSIIFLNKAGGAWLDFARLNSSGSENVFDLSNIGTATANTFTAVSENGSNSFNNTTIFRNDDTNYNNTVVIYAQKATNQYDSAGSALVVDFSTNIADVFNSSYLVDIGTWRDAYNLLRLGNALACFGNGGITLGSTVNTGYLLDTNGYVKVRIVGTSDRIPLGIYGNGCLSNVAFFGISTSSLNAASADIFIVDRYGNVGIGVTNPAAKLDVNGDLRVAGTATNVLYTSNNFVKVGNAGTINYVDGEGDLYVRDELEVDGRLIAYGDMIAAVELQLNSEAPNIYFGDSTALHGDYSITVNNDDFYITGNSDIEVNGEVLRIKGNGFVGIGTNAAVAKLHVGGTNASLQVDGPILFINTIGNTTNILIKTNTVFFGAYNSTYELPTYAAYFHQSAHFNSYIYMTSGNSAGLNWGSGNYIYGDPGIGTITIDPVSNLNIDAINTRINGKLTIQDPSLNVIDKSGFTFESIAEYGRTDTTAFVIYPTDSAYHTLYWGTSAKPLYAMDFANVFAGLSQVPNISMKDGTPTITLGAQWLSGGSGYVLGLHSYYGTSFIGHSYTNEIARIGTTDNPTNSYSYFLTNVGIGTNNPTERLHVMGNALIESNLTVNGRQSINCTNEPTTLFVVGGHPHASASAVAVLGYNGNSTELTLANLATPNAGNTAALGFSLGNEWGQTAIIESGAETAGALTYLAMKTYDATDGSPEERVRITSSGNVGIATNNPTERLHVVGHILIESNAAVRGIIKSIEPNSLILANGMTNAFGGTNFVLISSNSFEVGEYQKGPDIIALNCYNSGQIGYNKNYGNAWLSFNGHDLGNVGVQRWGSLYLNNNVDAVGNGWFGGYITQTNASLTNTFAGLTKISSIETTLTNLYEDLNFQVTSLNPPGLPDIASLTATAGPSANMLAMVYDASGNDVSYVNPQTQHSWVAGSKLWNHIHVIQETATTGHVVMAVHYSTADIGGNFPAATSSTNVYYIDGTQWKHRLFNLPTNGIEMTSFTGPSTVQLLKMERLGDDTRDTYAQGLFVIGFDVHYRWRGSPMVYDPE